MSQNVTLPATISAAQSLAVEALASNESEQWSVVNGQWIEADRVTEPAAEGGRGGPVPGALRTPHSPLRTHFGTTTHAGCPLSSPLKDAAIRDERPMSRSGSSRGCVQHRQMLEKGPQNCHFRHFSACPARPPGAKARSASRSVRSKSNLSWVALGVRNPRGYRCTETATPISTPCSLSQAEILYPDYLVAKSSKGRATQASRTA